MVYDPNKDPAFRTRMAATGANAAASGGGGVTTDWDKMMQYGAGGAAAGAMVGGPIGGAVGGIGSALYGLFSGGGGGGGEGGMVDDQNIAELGTAGRDAYGRNISQLQGRDAYQMGFNPELRQSLIDAAMGRAPSAAEMQMNRGLDQTLSSHLAARASQRGGRVGASNRLLSRDANQARLGVAGQAAQLRAQEQAGARQLASGVEGQIGQQNMQSQIQNQQMIDSMTQYYTSLGVSIDEANRRAKMELAQMQMNKDLAQQGYDVQREGALIGAGSTLVAGGAQAAPALAAASDVRAKQNIREADADIESIMDTLKPYEFDYKDEKHGKGKHLGVMAQDLEKSEAGKHIVIDGPTKMVDLKKALMAALAANANLHKRVKKLEK